IAPDSDAFSDYGAGPDACAVAYLRVRSNDDTRREHDSLAKLRTFMNGAALGGNAKFVVRVERACDGTECACNKGRWEQHRRWRCGRQSRTFTHQAPASLCRLEARFFPFAFEEREVLRARLCDACYVENQRRPIVMHRCIQAGSGAEI